MVPATPALRRPRDEGNTATLGKLRRRSPHRVARRLPLVRAETERRAAPLGPEDQVVQSMPDASPTKWHRAHTTWFLEQFLLVPRLAGYRVFDERFAYLFNSYYVAAGPRHARPMRGLVTRPDCEDVTAFRAHVDAAVERLIATASDFGAGRGGARARDRSPSRAAAPGAPAHRHPACLCAVAGCARLRSRLAAAARAFPVGSVCRAAVRHQDRRLCRRRLFASTTRGRRTKCSCSRRASRAAS